MSEKRTNILGWLTLIAVLAAIWVLFGEGRNTSSIGRGEPLVMGLMDKVEQTRKIVLSQEGEHLTIVASGSDWIIQERAGYLADAGKVRGLLRSLALSERREPKTGNISRLERIGLGSSAIHVSLLDAGGESLTALSVGNQRTGTDGNSHAYVLVDGEQKSWLVTAVPAVDLDVANWVDANIISINKERISTIDFDIKNGPDYALVRYKQGDDFGLNNIKPDEKAVEGYDLNKAASIIADLGFVDVRKAQGEGSLQTMLTVTTFDGLVLKMAIVKNDGEQWFSTTARYDVTAIPDGVVGEINGAPEDGKLEADLYNERHAGWQYRLNEGDIETHTSQRDSYLQKDMTNLPSTP